MVRGYRFCMISFAVSVAVRSRRQCVVIGQYESRTFNCSVYFDDVVMTHTKSNIIQYNEYYPFGRQTTGSWTRENVLGNNFLANSGTELNPTSALYDLDYRNYDPVLGRMNGVDPMATKYASLTPYNFSFNDPVTFTDVSGADPWDSGPYGGSMLYYYSMNSNWMSPGQESIMDNSGNAFGPGGGNLNWNPVSAGGYGMQAGEYLNSMHLNYENLQTIRASRPREGGSLESICWFLIAAWDSEHGGSWSESGARLFGSKEDALNEVSEPVYGIVLVADKFSGASMFGRYEFGIVGYRLKPQRELKFADLWSKYGSGLSHKDKSGKELYDDYCAINLSEALIQNGLSPGGTKCYGQCSSDSSHSLRAEELANWLKGNLGTPKVITGQNFMDQIKGKTGIVFFQDYYVRPPSKARVGDHIDLWNKNQMGSSGVIMTWIRNNFRWLGQMFGKSDLSKSTQILFWEIP